MKNDVLSFTSEDVMVRAQSTPNPKAIKFICNYPFKIDGKATFTSAEEAKGLVLVESLFDIFSVTQVHLFKNTLTVSHNFAMEEEELVDAVEAVIVTRLPVHNPRFEGEGATLPKPAVDRSNKSADIQRIEEILDRTVRPGLQADGGDLDVISFENNEVKILYQGACGGCPSAMMGTLDAIQSILRHELDNPEIKVRPL